MSRPGLINKRLMEVVNRLYEESADTVIFVAERSIEEVAAAGFTWPRTDNEPINLMVSEDGADTTYIRVTLRPILVQDKPELLYRVSKTVGSRTTHEDIDAE